MDIIINNKVGIELVTSPFSGCQIFSESFLCLAIHPLVDFEG